jgi:hypothetical protein
MHPNIGHKRGCAIACAGQIVNRPARIIGLSGILFFVLLFSCLRAFSLTVPAGHVTLAWEPSSDTNVVGYNIYYGVASHTYPNMINVGNVTNTTISGLVGGTVYYFAVTAYDGFGDESDFSDEISYLVPNPSTVQIHGAAAGQFILTLTGQAGHIYEIQATQDFKTWTIIDTVTMGVGGSLDFVDTNASNFPQRFYRTLDQSMAASEVPVVQIHNTAAGQFILTATGQPSHTYEIQATQDFKTWTTIGAVTMGAGGSFDFTDTNAQNFPERFYRTHDVLP